MPKRNVEMRVLIGSYTRDGGEGIYVFRLDLESGELQQLSAGPRVENPSYLAIHPDGRHVYSVCEVGRFRERKSGGVSAFAFNAGAGKLELLNQQPSGGQGPCYVSVDAEGRFALVANYSAGSVSLLPIADEGRLHPPADTVQHRGASVHPRRQTAPHAHSIIMGPENRFAYACDLGLDKVLIYQPDPRGGELLPAREPFAATRPGAGPRHIAFHPNGQFAYVINELDSTVTAFARDAADGSLRELQTLSTLPDGFEGDNTGADIHVAPSGRFVYGSNRGHDSIAVFAIDDSTGELAPAGHTPTGGRTPRGFGIDPTGAWLVAANQNTNDLFVFHIDGDSGALTGTGQRVEVSLPVCVKFHQLG